MAIIAIKDPSALAFESEVESHLRSQRSRRHVVSPAERRQEVIKRILVRDVDAGQAQAPFVCVSFEKVIVSNRRVEETSVLDARRIMVAVARAWRRNAHQG